MNTRKLTKPKTGFRYSFRMPNGDWHGFALIGETESGRLEFINTNYGTTTTMTPARFSFMYAKYMKKIEPYVLKNNIKVSAAEREQERQKAEQERKRREEISRARAKEEEDLKFKELIYRLKSLPLDVESAINKKLNVSLQAIAVSLETRNNFDLYTADAITKTSEILKHTPYALPEF